jgi:hypothetical protein
MKPLEEFPCENKTQQMIREQYWIEQLKPELNCRASYQTPEDVKFKKKTYNKVNVEVIKEQQKEWYKENCETIKVKQKTYHQLNKNIILEKKSVKYTCECGSICRIGDKALHKRTMKHQSFIALTP